ncbi:MAG: putative capsular polysaccharide synthesis family protein [Pirellulales bacterium]
MRKAKRALELFVNYYLKRRTPTVVYSMERSGSIVVFESLIAHGEFAITTHHLDRKKIETGLYSGSAAWASKNLILKGKKVKIISLVRNPVQSMVSYFARSAYLDYAHGKNEKAYSSGSESSETLSQRFTTEFLEKRQHYHHLQWFDDEFKSALGVDVYRYGFDKNNGHVRFEETPYEVLILRTDIEDSQKSQIVSDFLGLADFSLLATTLSTGAAHGTPGDLSPYAEKYKALKQNLTIPEEYLGEILESKYATHFFEQDTLDATRQQFQS